MEILSILAVLIGFCFLFLFEFALPYLTHWHRVERRPPAELLAPFSGIPLPPYDSRSFVVLIVGALPNRKHTHRHLQLLDPPDSYEPNPLEAATPPLQRNEANDLDCYRRYWSLLTLLTFAITPVKGSSKKWPTYGLFRWR